MVFDAINGTVYYSKDEGNPGTATLLDNYTLPNIRGNRYTWNETYTQVHP
jgi:hypothetical protein